MKVCIAEKPSVAKEIAMVIGAKQRHDGYFEGNGYCVTWTFGHLCTLKEPEDYDPALKRWSLESLPIMPDRFSVKLIRDKGVEKQFNTIKQLVHKAEEVINCGDAGQEGEVIQRWVLHHAGYQGPIRRLWISSLTEEAIRQGFGQLRDSREFDLLYAAGSARAIGDWLLGINATRLYTRKYANFGQLLSIGRVQTPTLALIVNRQKEIEQFRPETYWELKTRYREVLFSAKDGKFKDKAQAEALMEQLRPELFTITSFTKKQGKEYAPKLYDLTSLQVACNKRYGFSADQTLKLAQSLYEKKVLTYPRVDTTHLPNDQYAEVPGILQALHAYQELVAPLLQAPIRKSPRVFDDKKVTDHHAIIPTKQAAVGLSQMEHMVYDMVAKVFIAAFYPDCIVSKAEALGQVQQTVFRASGKVIVDPGWRVVFQKDEDKGESATDQKAEDGKSKDGEEQEPEQLLPDFQQGEQGPHAPELQEKQTTPPKPYTEATLLRAMETAGKQVEDDQLRDLMKENGIGRPSTRANIIETLFKRNYIRKERKNLIATPTGVDLIDTINYELLKSAELTGLWEKKLREIEDGKFTTKQFMQEMREMVGNLVQTVRMAYVDRRIGEEQQAPAGKGGGKPKGKAAERPQGKAPAKAQAKEKAESGPIPCPVCKKGEMLKGKAAYGCSGFRDGSCSFKLPFSLQGKTLTDKQLQSLLLKGRTPTISAMPQADGSKQDGYLTLDAKGEVHFHAVEEAPLVCPSCGKGHLLKGKAAYGCSEWKSGCNLRIPFAHMGKTLTDAQLKALVRSGKTPVIKGFTDSSGQKVNGRLLITNGIVGFIAE